MFELISILFLVAIIVFTLAAVGHILWLLGAAILGVIFSSEAPKTTVVDDQPRCRQCNHKTNSDGEYCGFCGCLQLNGRLEDLAATERTLNRLHRAARIDDDIYVQLKSVLETEHAWLTSGPVYSPPFRSASDLADPVSPPPETRKDHNWQDVSLPLDTSTRPSSIATASVEGDEAVPAFVSVTAETTTGVQYTAEPEPEAIKPRRRFSDMLNSFMEESNIRWGEIIGGLLIIGCSTALVVSLWAQISQIPVLKFLIFTTVTAVLFGIGLYTEHRWKLPNTSLGILTIATLLVPLNFLAIAAVSSGAASGSLILASEIIAPAIFLTLVYYAGRVITPGCARFLSLGILLSSIGQLLVRHFATPDIFGLPLVVLGAVPVVCFIAAVGLTLRSVLAHQTMDEPDIRSLFTMLGAMSFASALPFGLLLYKAGPLGMTMMYLAPTVTMWGLPLLITGVVIWRKVKEPARVATRTAAATLALVGATIAVAGVVLSWPNPASIVPSALITFFVFTAIAVTLELPVAHLLAAICLALAYLVTYHVNAGHVPWTNLRVFSLLDASLSASTGEVMVGVSLVFIAASEWLRKRRTNLESVFYLIAAVSVAVLSLILVTTFGVWSLENHHAWLVYFLYSAGAFWIAWRRALPVFGWTGSALLLCGLWQAFGNVFGLSFPWQTAFLLHGAMSAILAVILIKHDRQGVLWKALYFSGFISSAAAVVCLFQGNPWQVTAMQAERVFWIAGTWLVLLWINRKQLLFIAVQIAITAGVILAVKAALQACDWYAYLPHAFLHPTGLLIQATVLLFVGLAWIAVRIACQFAARKNTDHWTNAAWKLLDSKFSVDRAVSWTLLGSFLLLIIYAVASGVTQELAAYGSDYNGYNLAGFPRQEVLGFDSWIVFALLMVTFLAHVVERRCRRYLLGVIVVSAAIVPLIAGLFEPQIAVASAWRWLAALYFLAGSVVLWYRTPIAAKLRAIGWPRLDTNTETVAKTLAKILVVLSVTPLVLLTLYPSLRAIYYLPVRGPAAGIFSVLSLNISYSVPFLLVALVFIGCAIRERSGIFALAGGWFLNAAVTIAYLLSVVAVGGLMDRVVLVRFVQLNAITTSLFALAWLIYRRRWQPSLSTVQLKSAHAALNFQLQNAVALNILLIVPAFVALVVWPTNIGPGLLTVGSVPGWLALATAIAAVLIFRERSKLRPRDLFFFFASFVCMLSFVLADFDVQKMSGLHALTVGMTATAFVLFAASSLPAATLHRFLASTGDTADLLTWRSQARRSAVIAAITATCLTLRPGLNDPAGEWWVIAPLLTISGLFAALHSKTLKRAYLVSSAVLFITAGAIWWLSFESTTLPGVTAFIQAVVLFLSVATVLSLWLELRTRVRQTNQLIKGVSVHDVLGILALSTILLLVVIGLFLPSGSCPLLYFAGLSWTNLGCLAVVFAACLYDLRSRHAVGCLYLTGLLATGLFVQQVPLAGVERTVIAVVLLSVQALAAAVLWRNRSELVPLCRRVGITPRIDDSTSRIVWLLALNGAVVGAVLCLALFIILRADSVLLRLTAAVLVLSHTITAVLLTDPNHRQKWQSAAIAICLIGLVFFGWAWVTPLTWTAWLNRGAILIAVMGGVIAFLTFKLSDIRRSRPDWSAVLDESVTWIMATAAIGISVCLGIEVIDQLLYSSVLISLSTFFVITITLIVGALLLIFAALSPERDPLGLSERGRMTYVYAAEVILAVLFVHVRLTMPWLFGSFERFWPFIVMAVAYTGVVVSDWLRRRQLTLLARPIESTGAFLPLLPVLGFWIADSEVDYSALLFIVGGLYGLLCLLRRSFSYGVIAAVFANGALWYFLQRTQDYQFLQHPQLWLIPVALCVLLATHLNEDDFTEDQLTSTRYLSLATIYLSSTADIIINGVATSPWLPLILGAFSLAGIFGGILLRIRGMLLLGSTFLLFAIITMIWYASADLGWTWLWYVAGIVTGATIIFMFAVFEKKRSEVLRLVEGLRDWER